MQWGLLSKIGSLKYPIGDNIHLIGDWGYGKEESEKNPQTRLGNILPIPNCVKYYQLGI